MTRSPLCTGGASGPGEDKTLKEVCCAKRNTPAASRLRCDGTRTQAFLPSAWVEWVLPIQGDQVSIPPASRSPRTSLKRLCLQPVRYWRPPKIPDDKIRLRQRCWYNARANGEARRVGGEPRAVRGETLQANRKNKTALTLIDKRYQSIFFKGLVLNNAISSLGPCWLPFVQFPFPLLTCTCLLIVYLPVHTIRGFFKCPSLDISRLPHALPSLSGYQDP